MTSNGKLGWVLAAAGLATGLGLLLLQPRESRRETSRQRATAEHEPRRAVEVAEPAAAQPSLPSPASSAPRPKVVAVAPVPSAASGDASSATRPAAVPVPASSAEASPPLPLATAVAALASSEPPPPSPKPRRVSLLRLAAWSKPGMCSTSEEVDSARAKLTAHFRRLDAGESGTLLLDPRLPEKSETAVLGLLAGARTETERSLGLQPPPPTVFVYSDQQLMKAAACINEDVVAFYDGALHLVMGRDDLQQSVSHEYAHHALFSSGLVGPAWAQEGIAMNLAGETWWQQRSRLQSLLRTPFSAEQMDELIPYKLSAEQAAVFYVQAALTVRCLMRRRAWSLQQLADTLRSSSGADSVSYVLPELGEASFLGECAALR